MYNKKIKQLGQMKDYDRKDQNNQYHHKIASRTCGDSLEVYFDIIDGYVENYNVIGETAILTKAGAVALGEILTSGRNNIDQVLDLTLSDLENAFDYEIPKRRIEAATLALRTLQEKIKLL